MDNGIYIGTEVKYLVNIEADGFVMDRDDFEITLRRGTKERTFAKSELVREESVEEGQTVVRFYLCFDTQEFGAGTLTCIVRAYVPDSDFPDGLRTEVTKFALMNVLAV